VKKKVSQAQLFDLDVAHEASKRLAAEQPFKSPAEQPLK
jgi:hypothetical protein